MLKKYQTIFLLLIIGVGLILRLVAVYPGHPPNHPDEPFVYDRAADMVIRHSPDPQKFYFYQILPMYIHAVTYGLIFVPATLAQDLVIHPHTIIENLPNLGSYIKQNVIEPNALYWGRYVVAFLGAVGIFIILLLGEEIYDIPTGLIAAFLLAFNYRHFLSSVLSLNDIPNAVATSLTTLFLIKYLKKPTGRKLVIIGLLTGVTFSMKFQPFIFIPVGVALLISAASRKTGKRFLTFFKESSTVFLVSISVIILANIFAILHWTEFNSWLRDVGGRNTVGKLGLRFYPYWFLYTIGVGPFLSLLSIVGLLASLLQQATRKYILIIFFYLLWVFFFLSYYSSGGMFVRYFVPVIPFILLFASFIIWRISSYAVKFIPIPAILIAIILAAIFNIDSIKNTIVASYSYTKPSTLSCADNWVHNVLPEKAKVGIFPPAPMPALINKKTDWVYFNEGTDFTLPELQDQHIQYVIINQAKYSTYFIRWVMQGTNYWNMPVEVFDNMLPGLVVRELKDYTVYQCYKPWQAPEDNITIIKIPPKITDLINTQSQPVKKIDLASLSEWKIYQENSSKIGYNISTTNNCRFASCYQVTTKKESSFDFVTKYANYGTPLFFPPRVESPKISVQPGSVYQLHVWVKPQKLIPGDRRDGFFRLDFYSSDANYIERKSNSVFVSKRVAGDDWQQISLEGISPNDAKFLTVSFQSEYFEDSYLVGSIELSEIGDNAKDLLPKKDVQIDKKILYPSFIL